MIVRRLLRNFAAALSLGLFLQLPTTNTRAESSPDWIVNKDFKSVVPGAIDAGPLSGDPPVAKIYGAGKIVGYAFEISTIVETVGFSGAPFRVLIGLGIDGEITGATIVEHTEPILKYGGEDERLDRFVTQYAESDYLGRLRLSTGSEAGEIDGISGATVSARAFHHAIVQSARTVARSLGLISDARTTATVDMLSFEPLDWGELVHAGAVQGYDLRSTASERSGTNDTGEDAAKLYIALLTPASIGRNMVSRGLYKTFISPQSPDDLVFLLMSDGGYSFVGKEVFDTGVFDRIRVRQRDHEIALRRQNALYRYVPFLTAENAPTMSEMGIFRIPAESGIDVLQPWELLVKSRDEATNNEAFQQALVYHLPERFVLPAAAPVIADFENSPVETAWQAQLLNLVILGVALGWLTVMLVYMEPLTRSARLYRTMRISFLMFTLIWLGWLVGAQFSVINPIAWFQASIMGNGLELFLLDPLLAVLTVFVIATFFVWGRGVFCGWLCPFGALQELLSLAARSLKVPQISLSHATHSKLWPLKYVVLAVVVLSATHSSTTLGAVAEVEPFKTAISLKFDRSWPYVAYVVGLLSAGLFIERAFCRFLCPLGAMMAIGGKLRLGKVLKRRDECGNPCQLCSRRCPVQAIAPSGQIRMDECFYCLDCQVIYHDTHRCPPLINSRKRARLLS